MALLMERSGDKELDLSKNEYDTEYDIETTSQNPDDVSKRSTEDLLSDYCVYKSNLAIRNEIFNRFMGYADRISKRYSNKRMPYRSLSDADDIISYGREGLLKAIETYDPDEGTAFKTHAGIRIAGCIIDNLRSLANFPRSVSKKKSVVKGIIERLLHENGKIPSKEEILAEFPKHHMIGDMFIEDIVNDELTYASVFTAGQLVSSGKNSGGEDGEENYAASCVERSLSKNRRNPPQLPGESMERADFFSVIMKILNDNFEKPAHRHIVMYYFMFGMTSSEISRIVKVSETIVSTKKIQAINVIKKEVRRNPELRDFLRSYRRD